MAGAEAPRPSVFHLLESEPSEEEAGLLATRSEHP